VPELKAKQFRFEEEKFDASGLTPMQSKSVQTDAGAGMPGAPGGAGNENASLSGNQAG